MSCFKDIRILPFTGLLAYWLTGLLAYWLTGLLAYWLTGLLAYWLTGLLAYWLTGLLAVDDLLKNDAQVSRGQPGQEMRWSQSFPDGVPLRVSASGQ
ncbi:hypothetical protein GCM10009414_05580 [Tatumella terrea]